MRKSSSEGQNQQESKLRLPDWLTEAMNRGRELLQQWVAQEASVPFVDTPRKEAAQSQAPDGQEDRRINQVAEGFFAQGDEPPVPHGEADMRGFEEGLLQQAIRRNRLTALITGFSIVSGAGILAAACLANGEKDPHQAKDGGNSDPSADSEFAFHYDSLRDIVQLELPGNHLITVMDYNQPEAAAWNTSLPDQASLAVEGDLLPGKTNRAYRYHVETVQERLGLSEEANSTAVLPSVEWDQNVFARLLDHGRVTPGNNLGYDTFYGNMDVGNRTELTDRLVADWKEYASVNGWSEDLSELSTYQWMQLIQLEGSQIQYDDRQVSAYPEYDATLTDAVWNMPVSDLVARGLGVCRDIERVNVTSYAIADDLYDLADRGLLYYSMANISDAKHARSMFLVATSQTEMVAVGVDTTNMQGDPSIAGGDTTPADSSLWYSQDAGREWFHSAGETALFYRELLKNHGPDLSPTTRALGTRELAVSEIQLASPILTQMSEETLHEGEFKELVNHLVGAFMAVQAELLLENAGSSTYYLDLPVRQVHLLDGLIMTGRSIDMLKKSRSLDMSAPETIGPYQGMALDMFVTYMNRTGYTSADLDEIRRRPERVQFNDQEIARIDQAIQERLQQARAKVGNAPDHATP